MRVDNNAAIDRSRPITFSFDGRVMRGYVGDTLASALLANDVSLVARSFKYHRPRGVMSAGLEETNALVEITLNGQRTPNVLATRQPLREGLVARSQNRWPTLGFDLGGLLDVFSCLFPAGFYYKTFMYPKRFWMFYERVIRRIAGIGFAPQDKDKCHYAHQWHYTDVLVVGGGLAGLSAALGALSYGKRVLLVEQQAFFGGHFVCQGTSRNEVADLPPGRLSREGAVAAVVEKLATHPNCVLKLNTVATGYHDQNLISAVEGNLNATRVSERHLKIRAKQVCLATGAIERPLVFADNDRPGVMLASAVAHYFHRYAVVPCGALVIFTNNNSAYGCAFDLASTGITVSVVDIRPEINPSLVEKAQKQQVAIFTSAALGAVIGRHKISAVVVHSYDCNAGKLGRKVKKISCRKLAISGGWNPAVHLYSQAGGQLEWDETLASFRPSTIKQRCQVVGALNAEFDETLCVQDSFSVGERAAMACEELTSQHGEHHLDGKIKLDELLSTFERVEGFQSHIKLDLIPCWTIKGKQKLGKCFTDFQSDVTEKDIALAAREGYISVEHCKRYTTNGMGVDQGKSSNINSLAILAQSLNRRADEVGTTKFRPPFAPITFGTLAGGFHGEFFKPLCNSPLDQWHSEHGAVFEETGGWRVPNFYLSQNKEVENKQQARQAEYRAVRRTLAIRDTSHQGKLELFGPDALRLLDRFFTAELDNLAIGQWQYNVLLNEEGVFFTQVKVVRLECDRYLLLVGTELADSIYARLETSIQLSKLTVFLQWKTCAIASMEIVGPQVRQMLEAIANDLDIQFAEEPLNSIASGSLLGLSSTWIFNDYLGEFACEIFIDASKAIHVWNYLIDKGGAFGIKAFGSAAFSVLRIEKGRILEGVDNDTNSTADDMGLSALVSDHKKAFIGKRGMRRSAHTSGDRYQVVGIKPENIHLLLPVGSHIVDATQAALSSLGYVTSSCFSDELKSSISFALIKNGRSLHGCLLAVKMPDGLVRVRVCDPVFLDVENKRVKSVITERIHLTQAQQKLESTRALPTVFITKYYETKTCSLSLKSWPRMLRILSAEDYEPFKAVKEKYFISDYLEPCNYMRASDNTPALKLCHYGPSEWLIVESGRSRSAEVEDTQDLKTICDELTKHNLPFFDIGDGYCLINIEGAGAVELLTTGTSFNVSLENFKSGQLARTLLAKVDVCLLRTASSIELLVESRYTDFLWRWLNRSADLLEQNGNGE